MSKKVDKKRKHKKGKKRTYNSKKAEKRLKKQMKKDLKFRKVKGSIEKDDIKALRKELRAQTRFKKLEKIRANCVHHHKTKEAYLTVPAYKIENAEFQHLVPLLNEAVKFFEEQNIGICPIDHTPVIDLSKLDNEEVIRSITYLYLAINTIKGTIKLKKGEMEKSYKLQMELLNSLAFITKALSKINPPEAENYDGNGKFSVYGATGDGGPSFKPGKKSFANKRAQVSQDN